MHTKIWIATLLVVVGSGVLACGLLNDGTEPRVLNTDLILDEAETIVVVNHRAAAQTDELPSLMIAAGSEADDVGERMRAAWENADDSLGTDFGEVTTVLHVQLGSAGYTVVEGRFDLDEIRDELEDQDFDEDDYRGFQVWNGAGKSSVALLEEFGMYVYGGADVVEDVLKALDRGEGFLAPDAGLTRAFASAGAGVFAVASTDCDERNAGLGAFHFIDGVDFGRYELGGCDGVAVSFVGKDRDESEFVFGVAFRSERRADTGVEDLEDALEDQDDFDAEVKQTLVDGDTATLNVILFDDDSSHSNLTSPIGRLELPEVDAGREIVTVVVTVVVERMIEIEREVEVLVVETVVVERMMIEVEKEVEVVVVETVVVERMIEVEKEVEVVVVETVVVERMIEVEVEKEVEVLREVPVVQTVVVEKEVGVEVPVTVLVEKEVEVAVPVTVLVEKEVEVVKEIEVVVEKEVYVEVTSTPAPLPTATPLPELDVYQSTNISAGGSHTCGLRTNGQVICWGFNDRGQASPPDGTFVAVSAGGRHTCALGEDSRVVCWGYNGFRQANAPGGRFIAVNAGGSHTCGLRENGRAVCWGNNNGGQRDAPEGRFIAISSGGTHSCGILENGDATCWGSPLEGTVSGQDFVVIISGETHACALRQNGTGACWTKIGEGDELIPLDGPFVAISAGLRDPAISRDDDNQGGNHTCALRDNGEVSCWGEGGYGQASPPDGQFVEIAVGAVHSCALRADRVALCWGDDEHGQFGP